jgi:hypothetical protein
VFDQNHHHLSGHEKSRLRSGIKQTLAMFSQLGVTTGSSESQKLFGA